MRPRRAWFWNVILGTRPEVVRTTNDHGELLDYLLAPPGDQKRVDLVGIYDEDPSVLLHDFLETSPAACADRDRCVARPAVSPPD